MSALSFIRRPLSRRFSNLTIVLIAVNVIVFLITWQAPRTLPYVALVPGLVIEHGWWWQVVSYMFVHGGFGHILFNMLALFIFGIQLEHAMGSLEYLLYYLFCGIAAGVATLLVNYAAGYAGVPVVGASGAIFGLLLAFAAFFPDARIFVFGILPLRSPTLVLVYAVIEVVFLISPRGSILGRMGGGVAHLTHLSGLVFGYLYLLVRLRMNAIKIFLRR
jgi:membrane associated rhomboid family serine protease